MNIQPIICIAWRSTRLRWKTSGMGCSWSDDFGSVRSIASDKSSLHFLSLQFVTSGFFRQLDLTKVIGKLAFVECAVKTRGKFTETLDRGVVVEWSPNVVHLPPLVTPGRIWKKKDARNWARFWGDVEQCAFGVSPDAVKFCFDKNAGPFPNRPANHLLAAIGSDVLRKNAEALIDWSASKWSNLDIARCGVLNHAPAKRNHVRLNQLGRSQGDNVR